VTHDVLRTKWTEMIQRRIIVFSSAALVGGQRHFEYLDELGMPRGRIFTGYDVIDNEYFRQKAQEIRSQTSEVRGTYRLPENYFLASARFIEKKNLSALIEAYAEYRRRSSAFAKATADTEVRDRKSNISHQHSPWDLVVLGDGPLRETLNSQLSTLGLHHCVHLPGFRPYDELPVYYALAKAFVHASTSEQWGLVVNEAVASGLPVIVSDCCGCAPELVQGNGFTFDPFDENDLAERLLKMASLSENERRNLSNASYRISANFAPERFGEGLERAVHVATGVPKKRFGV